MKKKDKPIFSDKKKLLNERNSQTTGSNRSDPVYFEAHRSPTFLPSVKDFIIFTSISKLWPVRHERALIYMVKYFSQAHYCQVWQVWR